MTLSKDIKDFIERFMKNHFNNGELRLENSGLRANKIKDLCELLNNYPEVTRLTLEDNQLMDRGAKLLAENLPSRINFLNLTRTDISDKGVQYILENKNIRRLILKRNLSLTDAILNMLKNAEHIVEFDVTENRIISEVLAEVTKILSERQVIKDNHATNLPFKNTTTSQSITSIDTPKDLDETPVESSLKLII